MQFDPEGDTEARDAFRHYMAYMHEQNPRYHETKQDFRDALLLLSAGEIRYERRTSGPNKGRWVFKGLRYRQNDEAFADPKVVSIFSAKGLPK